MANELYITTDTCVEAYRVLKCKEGDTRPLKITVLENGNPYKFTVSTFGIYLRVRLPNGTVVSQNADNYVDNTVNITMKPNITVPGELMAELNIHDNTANTDITTDTFIIDVKPKVG